jgi:spermidine/putrescine transport system substrate-binding protein
MKKFLAAACAALLLAVSVPVSAAEETSSEEEKEPAPLTGVTINVYNWGEYISTGEDDSMDVNAEFTAETGIQVNYTTFEDNESMYSKLAGGGANYDIIIPSDYMVSKLIDEGLVRKLDFGNIPNFQYIDREYRNPAYDPQNEYSVPYSWGVIGIFYNKNYVTEPVTSWKILWDEKYAGKILMFDNPRDSFGIAQKILGYSFNTTDLSEWAESASLLEQQKPLVQAYVMDQIFDKMASGEAWLAPYYAGDAVTLVNDNPDIGFAIPTDEGTNFFVDAICVPTCSQHPKEAEEYINFLCRPDVAAANMETVGYSTPETEARKLLPEEMSESEIFYPPEEIMQKSEVYVNLPEDVSLQVDKLWAQVKMGGPGETATLIAVLGGFVLLYILIVVWKKVKRRRELPRASKPNAGPSV